MKRTEIYINGDKATKYDLAMLLERTYEIKRVYRTKSGNLCVETV